MKELVSAVCAAGLLVGLSEVVHAETKIGFVDMPKAVQETNAGKKAKTELESKFKKKKKDLDKKDADIKKMAQDFEKKRSILSDDVAKVKQAEIQQEMLKFQDEVAKSQSEIQTRQQELTAPILEKMQKVIAKVSKTKGFNLVLQNSQSVLYIKPELDFTQEVVKAYNQEK